MKWTNSYRSFGLKTKRSTGLKTIEHKHSSTPIAVSPSNMHGMPDSSRPATRPAMSPAVLHATCRKPLTVFLLATVISHVHSISKSRVNRMPGSAHGTRDTTTPCTRHSTRGAGPTSSTR